MDGLPFTYMLKGCQDPTHSSKTTPIPTASPMIAPMIQPAPATNTLTGAASTIIPHLLTRLKQMQKLTVQMQDNQEGVGGQNNNLNTCCITIHQAETQPWQGQPHKPLQYFATKYWSCKNKRQSIRIPLPFSTIVMEAYTSTPDKEV